jgi:hypothetical protein
VPNTEAFANLPQLGSGGRKETAQQSIPAEPLHPLMPALGVAIQPLEDPGQLGRDRGLSLAKDMNRMPPTTDPSAGFSATKHLSGSLPTKRNGGHCGRARAHGRASLGARIFHFALEGIAECEHRPLIRIGSL